uniref:Uncharacterized protein n=1 Tax=Onchocerca volvulus TaxID=6282 RepID=A0A8R1TKY5_ONCVO
MVFYEAKLLMYLLIQFCYLLLELKEKELKKTTITVRNDYQLRFGSPVSIISCVDKIARCILVNIGLIEEKV